MIDKPETEILDPAEEKAEKSSSSKGEKLFDWLTYGGIGFLGVFAAGIPVGYWAKYGKGKGMFEGGIKSLQTLGMSAKSAEDAMMTSVLMQPGNAALIPIKIMENHKPELVDRFNRWMGDESHDASVEHDPKQTWGSLIKSRLAAWLAVFGGFRGAAHVVGQENFGKFENKFAEMLCATLGQPTHTPGLARIAENESKFFRMGKIASLDVFATASATVLLYLGSRFFARRNEEWHSTHIPHKPDDVSDIVPNPPFEKGIGELMETKKIFTAKVAPASARDISAKPRPESFSEALASKKAASADATPSLSA